MVESASLTMLKNAGAKAKAVDAELDKGSAEQAITVDVDNMSGEELDALINDQGIRRLTNGRRGTSSTSASG